VYRWEEAVVGRERRWQARWLLAQGWPVRTVAEAPDRDAPTIGAWVAAFREQGPHAGTFDQPGGSSPL
jgi:transposase